MKERIIELAEQAGFENGHQDRYGNSLSQELEQFAELIVKECTDLFVDQKYMILNPHEPFANERVRALKEHDKDTVRTIKGHFGVEE